MKNIQQFNCFISSPGDCKTERKKCQEVIEKINNSLARYYDIRLETFMWENDCLPDFGKDGQSIIDDNIEESNYDIFIGIMKNKFGSPTSKAGSGTEHEFNDALIRKSNSSESVPQILFFFGKEMVYPENFDNEQYENVKKFKEKIGKNGLYTEFGEDKAFEDELERLLRLLVSKLCPNDKKKDDFHVIESVIKKIDDDLDNSLKSYNEKTPVWVEPIISTQREIPINPTKNHEYKINIDSIASTPHDMIINAPSEFGLTSLSHYIKQKAWAIQKRFLYLDIKQTKKKTVIKEIKRTFEEYYQTSTENMDCILLDSVSFEEDGVMKTIKVISEEYKNIPLIIFNTLDSNLFLKSGEPQEIQIERDFKQYYLLPLQQGEIRKIVKKYIEQHSIDGDDETILERLTNYLETLNMHRTVKNCISILKAGSQIDTEYSPVNRTKLLEILLSTIFHNYDSLTYHGRKPDVKDCSFVLGYLTELLIEKDEYYFTDQFFDKKLRDFCTGHYIDLNLNYLLTALKENAIIGTDSQGVNYFKNSYWAFYFVAQRMNISKEFREKIYREKKYIDFPMVMEFYTGIDRNKEDALKVLSEDIENTIQEIKNKLQIPDDINPYEMIEWKPNEETLKKEHEKISNNVLSSGLPDEVKDKYADEHYNQTQPYNQVINLVMREYYFLVLMQQIRATSRALRNSDFIDNPKLKRELLEKITRGWNEINKLLIVLSPLLADNGEISFKGAGFYLDDEAFNIENRSEKRMAVLLAIPANVVRFFKDDLFSSKMGPLIINQALNEENSLIKHELMTVIIAERPREWKKTIEQYIQSLDKNSYFLSETLNTLNSNIDYRATEPSAIRALKELSEKCIKKHSYRLPKTRR